MAYKKIKSYQLAEAEMRAIWDKEYCDKSNPIFTFDNIEVKFYSEMFDHCFYESANRQAKDKSQLSLNRLEKIYWIKDTLQDSSAAIKQGWDSKKKVYDSLRRVAMVKGNYVVVIAIYAKAKARFITAFQIDDDKNLKEFIEGPDWKEKK